MNVILSILAENKRLASYMAMLLVSLIVGSTAVYAHELRPAVMDIAVSQTDEQKISVELNFIAEAFLANIDLSAVSDTDESANASRYDQIRALPAENMAALIRQNWPELQQAMAITAHDQQMELALDDVQIEAQENLALVRETKLLFSGSVPKQFHTVSVHWDKKLGSILIRFLAEEQSADYTEFLLAGGTSKPISLFDRVPPAFHEIVFSYLYSGIIHIIPYGLDHMLFVLALLAVSISLRPLLLQISLFTIAHTITLALASLKIVTFSVPLVETLIALSIVYVGLDNLGNPNQKVGSVRAIIIFCFGLLHGLGFATVLQDFGLPEASFVVGLISFNIGVEIGQILTILPIWIGLLFFGLSPRQFRRWFQLPVSMIILAISLFWVYERIPGIFA